MTTALTIGDPMVDRITGFKGTAVAYMLYLNGCERYALQPEGLTKESMRNGSMSTPSKEARAKITRSPTHPPRRRQFRADHIPALRIRERADSPMQPIATALFGALSACGLLLLLVWTTIR